MAESPAGNSLLAAWMKVQLAVRNGVDPSPHARSAAKLTSWHSMRPTWGLEALAVFAVDFIPEGWAYTDPTKQRIAIARDTYFTLAHEPEVLQQAFTSLLEGSAGMRRVSLLQGPYAEAAKARRAADGAEDEPGAGDRVQSLEADYRALLARLRTAREDGDQRALGEALGQVRALRTKRQALEQELARMDAYDETVTAMVKVMA
jgi:hypothetical protein